MSGKLKICCLFPEESQLVQNAVEKRIGEFATGRYCARMALSDLGVTPCAILAGSKREPIWPNGIVGSITHCDGFCAAVVARRKDVWGLGIDVELHQPLPLGILSSIASRREQEQISALPDGVYWDRLLFSAKESIYKAWYPLTGRWLGFHDAEVEIKPEDATFSIEIRHSNRFELVVPTANWLGRYLIQDGFVLTSISPRSD